MRGFNECLYSGLIHTHTINFQFKSCTCRWFMAFAVCAHLVFACDLFNQPLDGYSKPRHFVYRARRGAKKKLLTFSELAFKENLMPLINIPVVPDNRQELFSLHVNNLPYYLC